MGRSVNKLSVAIAASLICTPVLAVDPEPIEVGRFNLVPTVGLAYSHSDNVLLEPDGFERSSNLLEVLPSIELYTENEGGSNVALRGQVMDGNYSFSDTDDYTDWRLQGIANIIFDTRNSLFLDAYLFDGHYRRGTGYSQGGLLFPQLETYSDVFIGGNYQFGMDDAPNIVVELSRHNREFDRVNVFSQFNDVDRTDMAARFNWPVSPRTDIFIEYQNNDINYQTDPTPAPGVLDTRDYDETFIYLGVGWEATALTSGSIRLGNGKQDLVDVDRLDPSGFSFDIDIDWEPMTYSAVNLSASRRFSETFAFGDSLETTQFAVTWSHDWSERINSLFEYSVTDDDYRGIARADDIDSLTIGVNYAVQRWMDVNISYVNAERDASFGINSNLFSYKENTIYAGLTVSL